MRAEACLHLVDDEDDAVLVADPAQPDEKIARRGKEAGLALDGLDDERCDLLRGDLGRERALDGAERLVGGRPAVILRERHAVDLGRERPEPRLVRVRLRGHRQREHRPPVEAALEREHGRALRVRARELDGVLDRLGARVEERRLRRLAHRRELGQPLRELDVDLVGDDREVGVRELLQLRLSGLDDARVRVTDVQAAHAAREVDERVPVDVGQRRAVCLRDHDRRVDRERIGDDAGLPLEDRPGLRPGDLGLQMDCARDSHTSHAIGSAGRYEPESASGVYSPSGFQSRKPRVSAERAASTCACRSAVVYVRPSEKSCSHGTRRAFDPRRSASK